MTKIVSWGGTRGGRETQRLQVDGGVKKLGGTPFVKYEERTSGGDVAVWAKNVVLCRGRLTHCILKKQGQKGKGGEAVPYGLFNSEKRG